MRLGNRQRVEPVDQRFGSFGQQAASDLQPGQARDLCHGVFGEFAAAVCESLASLGVFGLVLRDPLRFPAVFVRGDPGVDLIRIALVADQPQSAGPAKLLGVIGVLVGGLHAFRDVDGDDDPAGLFAVESPADDRFEQQQQQRDDGGNPQPQKRHSQSPGDQPPFVTEQQHDADDGDGRARQQQQQGRRLFQTVEHELSLRHGRDRFGKVLRVGGTV